jgi:hypothetical protein
VLPWAAGEKPAGALAAAAADRPVPEIGAFVLRSAKGNGIGLG